MIVDGIGLAACTGVNRLRRNEPAGLWSMRGSRMAVEPLLLGFCSFVSVHAADGWIRIFSGFSVFGGIHVR